MKSRTPRIARLGLTGLLVTIGVHLGCAPGHFTTVEFIPTEGGALGPKKIAPRIYLDKAPVRPYRSLGLIVVTAAANRSFSEIIEAAVEKGKEVGCDLLIDRAVRGHATVPPGGSRWSVILEAPMRSRPGATVDSERSRAPQTFFMASDAARRTYVVVQQQPPQRREFLCGIYTVYLPREWNDGSDE